MIALELGQISTELNPETMCQALYCECRKSLVRRVDKKGAQLSGFSGNKVDVCCDVAGRRSVLVLSSASR